MDNIYEEMVLNRIIQGRLRIRLGDLVFYIYEPSREILDESFDIYEDAKEQAYFNGSFVEQEALEILLKYDMWSPFDDQKAEEMNSKIEDLKLNCFKNFFKQKYLLGAKKNLRNFERIQAELKSKKKQFDHLTCEGVGKFAMRSFIIENTTKNKDGSPFDFSKYSVSYIMQQYQNNMIAPEMFRKIARSSTWRQMWNASKKRNDVFGKPASKLDQFQLGLISYSIMYDNVYESPDCPKDKVIEDDDCLDGWFISEKRKREKEKKQAEIDKMLEGSKVAGSDEIYLVANDHQEAKEIYGLNDDHTRGTVIASRQAQLDASSGKNVNFKDLADVKQQRMMNAVRSGTQSVKGKGR